MVLTKGEGGTLVPRAESVDRGWLIIPPALLGKVEMLKASNWAEHSQRGHKEKVGHNFVEGTRLKW